jgi:hypothetical protein
MMNQSTNLSGRENLMHQEKSMYILLIKYSFDGKDNLTLTVLAILEGLVCNFFAL